MPEVKFSACKSLRQFIDDIKYAPTISDLPAQVHNFHQGCNWVIRMLELYRNRFFYLLFP